MLLSDILNTGKTKWQLELVAGGDYIERALKTHRISRPGVFLTGFEKGFDRDRIQLLGGTEYTYLNSLSDASKKSALHRLFSKRIPAVIIARGIKPMPYMLELSGSFKVPLFVTPVETHYLEEELSDFLSFNFARRSVMHGTLIDVHGVGIMLTGPAGVGKSECALDLVNKGAVLVSDDVVEVIAYPRGKITGTNPRKDYPFNHLIEIRGVGIIDVFSIFGIRSVRKKKSIEMIAELKGATELVGISRNVMGRYNEEILGVRVEKSIIPVVPGKSISSIIIAIALDYHIRKSGYSPGEYLESFIKRSNDKKAE